MNYLCLPAPVAQILRRLHDVISYLTVSNQSLLLRKAEFDATLENNNVSKSYSDRRSIYQILWDTQRPDASWMPASEEYNTTLLRDRVHPPASASHITSANDATTESRWKGSRKRHWPSMPSFMNRRLSEHRVHVAPDINISESETPPENYSGDRKEQALTPTRIPAPSPPQARIRPPGDEPLSPIHRLLQNPTLYEPIRRPRYPIVLCHGLYGFDVRGPASFPSLQMHYWSNVLRVLKKKVGAEVIVTGVPGTGSIESRAERMNGFLQGVARGRAINFVAHSMGGLDCRHLITHCQPEEYTPISLTTVSTPHRGSPFMDWCTNYIGIGKPRHRTPSPSRSDPFLSTASAKIEMPPMASGAQFTLSSLPSSFTTLLLSVIDSPAYSNLTTSYLENVFNPLTPDNPHVKYYSVAARTENINVWHPLWLPKMVLDGVEERERERSDLHERERDDWGNDGLVSVRSAKWGEFLGTLEYCDHWEIRGSRGLGADVSAPVALSGLGDGWSLKDWVRFVGAWKWEEERRERREGGEVRVPERPREGAGDEVVKSSTDKLSAVLDWIVDQVPSSSKSQASPTPAEVDKRHSRFDLERFYIALSRKLYDDGL